MNVFAHMFSRRMVSLNYKVMYTFFNESPRFMKKYAGRHLIDRGMQVETDVLIVRNPFDKLASFYSNKILGGECVSLSRGFVALLSEKFGFDILLSPKEKIAEMIPLEPFVDNLGDLFMEEPHLYPQTHCLNWIRPERIVRMESEMSVLEEMFPDVDFSVRRNASSAKTELDGQMRSKVMKLYGEDFRQFYPDLVA